MLTQMPPPFDKGGFKYEKGSAEALPFSLLNLVEFPPAGGNEIISDFSGDMRLGKITSQTANVQNDRLSAVILCAAAGCSLFDKNHMIFVEIY